MLDLLNKSEIHTSLAEALKKQNITVPTEIQAKVIPEAVKNRDLIIQSETGTGKTLAYLLPLFKKIDASLREMQAIILVPTHELAMQILRQIESLSQNSEIKATSTPIIGNVNIDRQII
jgi:superfamily II DNA/RNA helicase